MGTEYGRLNSQKISFLPFLCSRPSIKDINLPRSELRSESFAGDPLSPRISCIGQVKKRKNSNGFLNQTTSSSNVRYLKLKKLFSGKNLIAAASISVAVETRRHRVKNDGGLPKKGFESGKYRSPNVVMIVDLDLDLDMDPPLPVIKKVKNNGGGEGSESLWKRRSGGTTLRGLELQQIHHFRPHHLHLHV